MRPGQVAGPYVVEALIGTGGVAIVYRVHERGSGERRALKVLALDSPTIRQRMLREGVVQAGLDHPNILKVYEVLEVANRPALVLELIEGPTLHEWAYTEPRLLPDVLHLFRGIVRGVAHAHAAGLVHRDLKPTNVLLARTRNGLVPKVGDFGIVKRLLRTSESGTVQGAFIGTPEYAAPEQIYDATMVDHRADLFALGCILYELVCGELPFLGADNRYTLGAIQRGIYVDPADRVPDLPPAIASVIRGLLRSEPDDRIQSCVGLLHLLEGDYGAPSAAVQDAWIRRPSIEALSAALDARLPPESGLTVPTTVDIDDPAPDEATQAPLQEMNRVAQRAALDLLALQEDDRDGSQLGVRYARALVAVRSLSARAGALGLVDMEHLTRAMSAVVEAGRRRGRPMAPSEVNVVLRGLDALLVRIEAHLTGRRPPGSPTTLLRLSNLAAAVALDRG